MDEHEHVLMFVNFRSREIALIEEAQELIQPFAEAEKDPISDVVIGKEIGHDADEHPIDGAGQGPAQEIPGMRDARQRANPAQCIKRGSAGSAKAQEVRQQELSLVQMEEVLDPPAVLTTLLCGGSHGHAHGKGERGSDVRRECALDHASLVRTLPLPDLVGLAVEARTMPHYEA